MTNIEKIQRMWTLDSGDHRLRFIRTHILYEGRTYVFHISLLKSRVAAYYEHAHEEIKKVRQTQNFVDKVSCVGFGEAGGILYELYENNDGQMKLFMYDITRDLVRSAGCVKSGNLIDFIIE